MLYFIGILSGIYIGILNDISYLIGGIIGFLFAYVTQLRNRLQKLEKTVKSFKEIQKKTTKASPIDYLEPQTDQDEAGHSSTPDLIASDHVITENLAIKDQDDNHPTEFIQEKTTQQTTDITTADIDPNIEESDFTSSTDDITEQETVHTAQTNDNEYTEFERNPATQVPQRPTRPSLIDKALKKAQSLIVGYFTGGNSMVRAGLLILFIGVAFLLKYVAERTTVPVEFRYIGVSLGCLAMLILGWKLRIKRPGYALSLLGGGIGVLYLTLFAAMRLHGLLPAKIVILLLIVIVLLSAGLAILTNSMALAVIGMIGGYAAPILTSTGSGSHVQLFSYYALLNIGVFAIAWFKSWRILNVVGFIATFGIGSVWGYQYYQPEFLWSVEPFLILNFLMYTIIAVLFALKQTPDLKGINDGTLIFGTPLVGFSLQAALMKGSEYGLAYSALSLGVFYVLLSYILHKLNKTYLKNLIESFVALGIGFATLAIPLGFDGRVTSAMWVAEGSALVWVGIRQARLFPRLSGYALTLLGSFAFFIEKNSNVDLIPLMNADYIGVLIISAATAFIGLYAHFNMNKLSTYERRTVPQFMVVFSLLWWLFGGINEINHFLTNIQFTLIAIFILLTTLLLLAGAKKFSYDLLKGLAVIVTASLLMVLMITPELEIKKAVFFNDRFCGLMAISLFHFVMSWHWRAEKTSPSLGSVNGLLILFLSSSILTGLYAFITEFYCYYQLEAFVLTELIMALTAALLLFFGIRKKHIQYQLASAMVVIMMFIPITFVTSLSENVDEWLAVFNVPFIGYMIYAITQISMAWYWQRSIHLTDSLTQKWHETISHTMLIGGLMAWFICSLFEISLYAPSHLTLTYDVIFITVSVLCLILMAHKLDWRSLHLIKYTYLLALMIMALYIIMSQNSFHQGLGLYAWLAAAGLHLWVLRIYEKTDFTYLNLYHIGGIALSVVIVLFEGAELAIHVFGSNSIWHNASYSFVLISISTLLFVFRKSSIWPISTHQQSYITISLPLFVMVAWLMMFVVNMQTPGTLHSLPYMPLLNLIDCAGLMTLLLSGLMLRNDSQAFFIDDKKTVVILLALLGFLLLNASMLRCFHYWYGIEYDNSTLFASFIVQTGFSILWALTAVILMVVSARKRWRIQWLVGLGLMMVVVAKLFLIDMSASGSIERIVAFLTVGILLSIVGYFSPLPPSNNSDKALNKTIDETFDEIDTNVQEQE